MQNELGTDQTNKNHVIESLSEDLCPYFFTSSGSVEAPASQTNHSHRIHVGVGVALVDVVIVGVSPIVVDVVVVIVIVGVSCHDRSDVEGTACGKINKALE